MNKIFVFGFGLFLGGLFLSWMNDCWSYLSDYTPPSSDVFYNLMMLVWNIIPYFIMFLGIVLLIVSAKPKSITEMDDE